MGPKLAFNSDYSSEKSTEKKKKIFSDTWCFGPKIEKITQ